MAKNDAKWEALLRQAMEAARYAALEQYEKLVAAGPAYDVRNADLITGAAYGPSLGTMLDLCGFAGVKIRPANSSFVRYLRSQGVGRNDSYEGGVLGFGSDSPAGNQRQRGLGFCLCRSPPGRWYRRLDGLSA